MSLPWNSEFGGVSCTIPPMVGRDDSTVVGILQRSLAGGEGVGGCLSSKCFSEKQGTYSTYVLSHDPHSTHYATT